MLLDSSRTLEISTRGTTIFLRKLGTGPGLLLLHGFPETHLMWRDIAPLLAGNFTVIYPDLRGYGSSGCPVSDPMHTPYTKRAMAEDMVSVMEQLGFSRFSVAGHDRGGRVAYRLALDHPDRIEKLAVLDIIPIGEAWDRADRRLTTSFWPWSLLSQPAPFPEQLIAGAPEAIIEDAATHWGSPDVVFPPFIRAAYVDPLRDPVHAHAICEEFRAAATLDYEHDHDDLLHGRRIDCPVLVLWSADNALDNWYDPVGGPLAIWRGWANDVRGQAIHGGHFFPEEAPEETAEALKLFFSAGGA